ncbi:hypothetical protein PanWU01x14_026290 [Parasponia andersonii]|uniref:Uncharacterized protein n=1 Tax=Parasponia andersonii TaxID=3476 RepID=A0A2P5DW05_PARAD|nr:hypothetical protein PanWU01x14_026290 [Parasponia andersonii]
MGNYVSCALSNRPGGKFCKATKVIFPGGDVRRFDQPIKAAELMLEMPSFFVVNVLSLRLGRRFSPLNADEDLEMDNVYVFFPMKRVNSAVTAADMGSLFLTANSAAKRGGGGWKSTRVLPAESGEKWHNYKHEVAVVTEVAEVPKLNLDDIEDFSAPEFMHRMSMSRSKKPLLETIVEEPSLLTVIN